MAMPVRDQLIWWGIGLAVTLVLLWYLGDVILPFLTGGAIAYFLDPVADRLERAGFSRALATAMITLFAVLVFVLMALLIIPLLYTQLAALIDAAPTYAKQFQTFLTATFPSLMDETSTLSQSIGRLGQAIQDRGGVLVNQVLASAIGLLNAVVFMVVVPVVAFYMLLDWDRMIAAIDRVLPRDHAPTLRRLAGEVDAVLAGFVRGQLSVCGILGVFYALGLMLVGLQFGLVVGAIAGLISFIPYIGAIIGGALALGLALFQFWDTPLWIAAVAVVFMIGQFLEGNILTPKLVGGSVGLHPVWLLFALSAFGAVYGFLGLLIAVPAAAMIGVFARFAIAQYMQGRLYKGLVGKEEDGG